MITLVVFSKDRALQCDSLLRSVKDHCTGIDQIVVLAKASSELHIAAYKKLREEGEYDELTVNGVDGGLPLGEDIYQAINDSMYTALAVDDQLFYAPSNFVAAAEALDLEGGFIWSWRLGDGKQAVRVGDRLNYWTCSALSTDPDYGYLWHSDGALYKTVDYVKMLDKYLPDWRTGTYTPNDLEGLVATKRKLWAPHAGPHLGPLTPACVTWQLNLARRDYARGSPVFEIPETRLDALAQAYLDGKRVNNDALYGALSANPLRWNQPGDRPTHIRACAEASRYWASCVR
jgi:hypothetical protein